MMQLIAAKNLPAYFQLDGQARVTGWPISGTGWPIGHPVNMLWEALPFRPPSNESNMLLKSI